MSKTREFRFCGKKTAPLVWKITLDGDTYRTEHGQLGGKMQQNQDTPGPKGKPGTKAYVDPVANMNFHALREIRFKKEAGYCEYVDGKPIEEQITKIEFDQFLPKNFSSYKPQRDIEPKALEKLHASGKARYTRKLDGMQHVCCHHEWGWEIYTRRMDLTSERFPDHFRELEKLPFDVGTILVGEAVCLRGAKEDFKAISSFCRSLPEETRKIVAAGTIPEATFVIFDVLFHNRKELRDVSYDERAKLWMELPAMSNSAGHLIARVDYYDVTPETWEKFAKDKGWEGLVVTAGDAVPGQKFFSFDGDAQRPKGHYKLKPSFTEDCVAFAASYGTGKRMGGIGALHLKQILPDGKFHYLGKVGSGFTDEDLVTLEKLFKQHNLPIVEKDKDAEKMSIEDEAGVVCEIEFSERQPGTQKFRFPVFTRIHGDKQPRECTAQRLAPAEDE